MTNKRSTKRALLASVVSLLLCFTMLLGTTYAWFTDSVTSTNNIIKSGNLDVELYWSTDAEDWKEVNADTNVFTEQLWEPGHTEVVYLKVVNAGSLALKYQLGVNVAKETGSTNVNGNEFKLSDFIRFGIFDGAQTYTRDQAIAEAEKTATALNVAYSSKITTLLPKEGENEKVVTMVVYMPTTVGNDANHAKGAAVPTINLGINLFATQAESENDSFNNQYDADALFCDVTASPANAQDVIDNAAEGTVIGLIAGDYGDLVIQNADGTGKKNITLVSNSAVVDSVNLNGSIGITLDGLTFDANEGTTVWSYSAKDGAQDKGNVAGITDATKGRANFGSQNITVKNCTFVNTTDAVAAADAANYYCIRTTTYRASQANKNYTIENCVFACNAVQYISLDYVNGEVVVADNVFGGGTYGTSHNTINATSNSANWTITGNEFNNWNDEKTAIGSSRSTANGIITWTITDNVFNNDEDTIVLALKTNYNADNSAVIFENNTALNGNGTIVATETNAEAEPETVYAGHKIQLNDGVALVADATGFEAALKDVANNSVIVLMDDVTVSTNWDSRNTGGKTTVPVTIDGMGNTLKMTGTVSDGGNYHSVFRFEAAATVKNLTFDLSEAGGYDNRNRAISAKSDLTVDNCKFIGNTELTNTRAISYGEGVSAAQYDAKISITNCTFVNWKRGITDNENAKDVKTVEISGNTCTNASIYVSAYDSITVTGNTMKDCCINITSYSAADTVTVVATGNTLDASQDNTIGSASRLFNAANVTAQEGFVVSTN